MQHQPPSPSHQQPPPPSPGRAMTEGIVVKVGMVGDAGSGKTSLRRKFLAGQFGGAAHGHNHDDDEHLQYAEQSSNIGVNCVDKTVMVRGVPVTFSLWDLGSQRESLSMMPLVASDATAMLLVFDLSRLTSLSTSQEWWRKLKAINKSAMPLLIGCKYDLFLEHAPEQQDLITTRALHVARTMAAPLIFTSASHSVNVKAVFKVVLSQAFDLPCMLPRVLTVGEPILFIPGEVQGLCNDQNDVNGGGEGHGEVVADVEAEKDGAGGGGRK